MAKGREYWGLIDEHEDKVRPRTGEMGKVGEVGDLAFRP